MNTSRAAFAAHFRKRLKHEGISAACRSYRSCGLDYIVFDVPKFEACFSESDRVGITTIATALKLLWADYRPVNVTEWVTPSEKRIAFVIPPESLDPFD